MKGSGKKKGEKGNLTKVGRGKQGGENENRNETRIQRMRSKEKWGQLPGGKSHAQMIAGKLDRKGELRVNLKVRTARGKRAVRQTRKKA